MNRTSDLGLSVSCLQMVSCEPSALHSSASTQIVGSMSGSDLSLCCHGGLAVIAGRGPLQGTADVLIGQVLFWCGRCFVAETLLVVMQDRRGTGCHGSLHFLEAVQPQAVLDLRFARQCQKLHGAAAFRRWDVRLV